MSLHKRGEYGEARSQKPGARSQEQEAGARSQKWVRVFLFWLLAPGFWLPLMSCTSTSAPAPDPMADDAQNVRLVGYNDLQGRTALVVTTKSDPANGNWVYVGHHESFRDGKPLLNPITGKMEFNGTSILEISDPAHPRLVWHIPNESNGILVRCLSSTTTSSTHPATTT